MPVERADIEYERDKLSFTWSLTGVGDRLADLYDLMSPDEELLSTCPAMTTDDHDVGAGPALLVATTRRILVLRATPGPSAVTAVPWESLNTFTSPRTQGTAAMTSAGIEMHFVDMPTGQATEFAQTVDTQLVGVTRTRGFPDTDPPPGPT